MSKFQLPNVNGHNHKYNTVVSLVIQLHCNSHTQHTASHKDRVELSRFQVPDGAGHLLHRPVGLDLYVGPSAIRVELYINVKVAWKTLRMNSYTSDDGSAPRSRSLSQHKYQQFITLYMYYIHS